MIACAATLFTHGQHHIDDAADAAQSLRPLGGDDAFILFSVGLLNALLSRLRFCPFQPRTQSVKRWDLNLD